MLKAVLFSQLVVLIAGGRNVTEALLPYRSCDVSPTQRCTVARVNPRYIEASILKYLFDPSNTEVPRRRGERRGLITTILLMKRIILLSVASDLPLWPHRSPVSALRKLRHGCIW